MQPSREGPGTQQRPPKVCEHSFLNKLLVPASSGGLCPIAGASDPGHSPECCRHHLPEVAHESSASTGTPSARLSLQPHSPGTWTKLPPSLCLLGPGRTRLAPEPLPGAPFCSDSCSPAPHCLRLTPGRGEGQCGPSGKPPTPGRAGVGAALYRQYLLHREWVPPGRWPQPRNGRGYPLQPQEWQGIPAPSRGHLPLTPAPPHTPHLTAAWKEMQTPLGKGAAWGPAQGRRLLREPGPWSLHSKPCVHTPRSRNQQSRSGSKASCLVVDERSQQNGPCNSRRHRDGCRSEARRQDPARGRKQTSPGAWGGDSRCLLNGPEVEGDGADLDRIGGNGCTTQNTLKSLTCTRWPGEVNSTSILSVELKLHKEQQKSRMKSALQGHTVRAVPDTWELWADSSLLCSHRAGGMQTRGHFSGPQWGHGLARRIPSGDVSLWSPCLAWMPHPVGEKQPPAGLSSGAFSSPGSVSPFPRLCPQ